MKKYLTKAAVMRRHPLLCLAVALLALSVLYWSFIASDQYVSEAHIVVQRTDTIADKSSSLLSLITGDSANRDLLLLRDYLLSMDMMMSLEKEYRLTAHYSDPAKDFLSRLWSWNRSKERFHNYYLTRVSVTYDDYAGVLVVRVAAYNPNMAHAVASTLVRRGEGYMNLLENNLAKEQVEFVESQITGIRTRMQQARKALLSFQNERGVASPKMTLDGIAGVVAQLEQSRAALMARKQALEGYLTPTAPEMVQINAEIAGLARQISEENERLASKSNRGLNVLAEEQDRLERDAAFADTVYKTAIASLERQRIDAIRKVKSVQVIQEPTLPDYPMEPRRLYNCAVSVAVIGMLCVILSLLGAIIRDHRD